ncbi:MAG: putative rane-bound dehydrogenase [Planctomycetota bacterium]|nr:putative rane-bound dehydrogenase [Planctomycetota bacterium]
MPVIAPRRILSALFVVAMMATSALAANKPKVPEGFEIRLVATVPAVQYPCQVATAPGGMLFVAEDPMDQVGPYESKNGRILLFRDGKDPVVFAEGFRAVQGMAWHNNSLYVSHMPFLTIVKDTDGDGKSDSKTDLFKDLGPTNNQGLNDHIVSGLQFGMDGWLYISVGDKGIPRATGPDGKSIQIKGGGSVRCRPDGTGIEVIATGTRNHLEINLDAQDNIFSYDNTDDGLGWWTRVTHHIDGGYYGYAYDYHTRPDRFLNRMAEFGGGSPCGAIFYKEDAWPEKYRNVGYWAEWGKGKVHAFKFKPKGASFEIAEEINFAVPDGVENFRPIDMAVSYDGKTMYVADWGMGGWGSKTEKVGRVWAISPKEEVKTRPRGKDSDSVADQIKQLDHASFNERIRAQEALIKKGREALGPVTTALADTKLDPVARRHLIWALDGIAGGTPEATMPILDQFKSSVPDLRAQAARAVGLRAAGIAVEPLKLLVLDFDPSVKLQALIALGRLGDPSALPAIVPVVTDADPYVAFAARVALRRIGDWKKTAEIAGKSGDAKARLGVLSAMDEQYDPAAVGVLIEYQMNSDHPAEERIKALQYLSSVHRKSKPWDGSWWGTRPAAGEPPAKEIAWEATPAIVAAIHQSVSDGELSVRLAGIAAVKETKDSEALPILRERLGKEPETEARKQIALTLGALKDKASLPILTATLRDAKAPEPLREAALTAVELIGTDVAAAALVDLLKSDGLTVDRQPRVLAALGKFKVMSSLEAVVAKLDSPNSGVRVAAAESAAKFNRIGPVSPKLRPLVTDANVEVRKAAIAALGILQDRVAIPALLIAAEKDDTRFESTRALAAMPDLRSLQVYLHGLTDKNADLRKESAAALASIRDKAAPVLESLAERHELSPAALPELTKVFTGVQPIMSWQIVGPVKLDEKPSFSVEAPIDLSASLHGADGKALKWKAEKAIDGKGQVDLNKVFNNPPEAAAYAYAELKSSVARKAQFVGGSDDTLTVWVNGNKVYDFQDRRGFDPEAARFEADLVAGVNRILVNCGNRGGPWSFSVAASSPSEYAFLKAPSSAAFDPDAYRQFALNQKGSAEKGKVLFADLKGLACIKCHAIKGQGGTVGPDLADIGVKYPKDEIIQSILYPSAKIFSGYEPVSVALNDGRILTGIVKGDTAEGLEILDAEAKTIKIARADIDEKKVSNVSLMPTGLAEGLTKGDFADLISYLETLKDKPVAAAKP